MSIEIWKPVVGFESFYEISSESRIKSLARIDSRGFNRKERMMNPHKDSHGYYVVGLTVNGKTSYRKVHQLLLEAFVGPRPSSEHVGRHLNDNPADNSLLNLAWGTHQENKDDSVRNDSHSRGERNRHAVLNETQVREVKVLKGLGKSDKELAAIFGVTRGTINKISTGRTWKNV